MRERNWGIVLSYLNTGLNMFCGLFLSSYLVKLLGDTEYGLYQMVTSFLAYLVILEFGTGSAMTRNIVQCRAKGDSQEVIERNISTVWTITFILVALISVVAIIFYCELGNVYSRLNQTQIEYAQKIFIFQVVYLIVSFLSSTATGIIFGFEKYKFIPIISVIRVICRTVLIAALVYFYKYAIVIAAVDALISVLFTIYVLSFCYRKLMLVFSIRWFDWAIFKYTMPLCFAMFLQTIVNQANSSIGSFVIGIKLTPEQVSYYSIGLFVYGMFSSLTTIPISMYGPQIIGDITSKVENNILMQHLVSASRLITVIGSTVMCGFIVCGKQFTSIFYGEQYHISWYVALIIMVPMLINMSNGVLINVLDALNKRTSRSYILMISTVLNILLTVVFVDKWGIIGACSATALATVLGQIILMNIYYYRVIKIPVITLFLRTFRGIWWSQLLACIAGYVVGVMVNNIYASFLLSGTVYMLMFGIMFYCGGANVEERHLVRRFFVK